MNRNTDLTSYENTTASGGAAGSNLMYLLIGGGIGASLALLFAPKSGAEFRRDISDVAHRSYDETVELAGKLKDQSAQLYDVIADKADRVYEFVGDKFNLQSGKVGEIADRAITAGTRLAKDAIESGGAEMDQARASKSGHSTNVH